MMHSFALVFLAATTTARASDFSRSRAAEVGVCDSAHSSCNVDDDAISTGVSLLQTNVRLDSEGKTVELDPSPAQSRRFADKAIETHRKLWALKHAKNADGLALMQANETDPAQLPPVALRAFEALAQEKRAVLSAGSRMGARPKHPRTPGSVFEAVEISLPLTPPILKHDPKEGRGQADKNIVGMDFLASEGRQCIVYGLGIADEPDFEREMGLAGCEVHAFDCSVDPKSPVVAGQPFKFHDWCIGAKKDDALPSDNEYVKRNLTESSGTKFKSLSASMAELGHTYIDLLKFDIEGFEWELFETEILPSPNPPEQISFELHTAKANPEYVPPAIVHGKNYVKVNRLFKALFDKGYRVASKELNDADPECAEFIALNVNK